MDQTISKGFVFLENAPELMRLLEDIFTDDFMQEYTRFESFEGFRYSSAVMVNWKADTLIYARRCWAFVKEHRLRHLGRDGALRHRPALPQITPVRGFSAQPARPLRASTGRPFGMLN